MQQKTVLEESLKMSSSSKVKAVWEYREKYERLDGLLQANPEILAQAHQEFRAKLSTSATGRTDAFTSEQLLRALIVMFVEGLSFRDAVVRLDESEVLREFVGLGWQEVMDHTFLHRAFDALSPETWARLNECLGKYAKRKKKMLQGNVVRRKA